MHRLQPRRWHRQLNDRGFCCPAMTMTGAACRHRCLHQSWSHLHQSRHLHQRLVHCRRRLRPTDWHSQAPHKRRTRRKLSSSDPSFLNYSPCDPRSGLPVQKLLVGDVAAAARAAEAGHGGYPGLEHLLALRLTSRTDKRTFPIVPFIYRCTHCRREFERDQVRYLCSDCGASYRPGIPLTGCWKQSSTSRRWEPFDGAGPTGRCFLRWSQFFPRLVGRTAGPAVRLGRAGGIELYIKNEARTPAARSRTGLFPGGGGGRAWAKGGGCVSTGNAASALAAVWASAGLEALIFVPEKAPRAKLVQMVLCGARDPCAAPTTTPSGSLTTAQRGGSTATPPSPLTIGKKIWP